jgi:hypothetical protein
VTVAAGGGEPAPEHRRSSGSWFLIIGGGLVALMGLLAIAGGLVGIFVDRNMVLSSIAEARTPGAATFTANDGDYRIFNASTRRAADGARLSCVVTLADERTLTVEGVTREKSATASFTDELGSFTAVAGTTKVFCTSNTSSKRFVIDNISSLGAISRWAVYLGVPLFFLGLALPLGGKLLKKSAPTGDSH